MIIAGKPAAWNTLRLKFLGMFKWLIRPIEDLSVETRWGKWVRSRDERSATGAGGTVSWPSGTPLRLSAQAVYAIITILIVISGCVNTFSAARDIAWRMGAPRNLWEPALWEITSGIVTISLLPLARTGALLVRTGTRRLVLLGFALAVLALAYSALHIVGMGLLREMAYRFAGWRYTFPWSQEIVYELRKNLFSFIAFIVIFWLAERSANPVDGESLATEPLAARPFPAEDNDILPDVARPAATTAQLWLRDGRSSILIHPRDIVSVTSAGNYVHYQLTEGRNHLIRGTLQAQESRLAPFGLVRVHRTRLINPRRIVALEWRASGDFDVRLDTGETILGSRRFKAAVASVAR